MHIFINVFHIVIFGSCMDIASSMKLIMLILGAVWIFRSFFVWLMDWKIKDSWIASPFGGLTIVAAVLLPEEFGVFGAVGVIFGSLLLYLYSFWKLDLYEREIYYRKISIDSEAAEAERIRQLEEEGKLKN